MSSGDRMPPELDATADALSAAWNAIVRGAPVGADADAASPFAPTLRRLHAIDDAPAMTPNQRARIWREVMAAPATNPTLVVLAPIPPTPGWPAASGESGGAPVPRPRWSTSFFATAAVLALIVGTVLLTVGLWQPNRWLHTGNPPGVLADEIVFRQRLDDIPASAMRAVVHHDALPPGATWQQGTSASSGVGPMVYKVETGAVAASANGAFQVTRRGSSSPIAIPAGASVDLASGDVAFLPAGVTSTWRNQGTAAATLLDAGLTAGGSGGTQSQAGQVAAIAQDIAQSPAAPAELALRRVTLAPGGTLSGAPTGGLQIVGVAEGAVEIGWTNHAVSDAIVATRRLDAGSWTDLANGGLQATTLRNSGDSPLTLLLLSVTPTSAGADATPAAKGTELLLAGRFDAIPSDASWIGVERYTAPPGAAWTQGAAEMSGVGPMLYRIERGAVTVQSDGQFAVTRAGASRATSIASGSKTSLASGDVAFMPSGVVTRWRNEGKEPADILDGGVTTVGAADLSMLKPFTQPINDWGVAPPKAPVDFTLQRLTVAPGATLRSAPASGMKLLAVESGTVDIVWSQPMADALQGPSSASASSAANAPDRLTSNHWIDIAQRRLYASELRNAGSEPLVVLLLTVAPAAGSQPAPAAPVAAS